MRFLGIGIATALLAGGASSANADCTCRGPGVVAHHGETVCLHTPTGPRLARCEMMLNNSSWTFLPDPCPEAQVDVGREFAASVAAPQPGECFPANFSVKTG
jgi:hypothetical protein